MKYLKMAAPYLIGAAAITAVYAFVPTTRQLISGVAKLTGGA